MISSRYHCLYLSFYHPPVTSCCHWPKIPLTFFSQPSLMPPISQKSSLRFLPYQQQQAKLRPCNQALHTNTINSNKIPCGSILFQWSGKNQCIIERQNLYSSYYTHDLPPTRKILLHTFYLFSPGKSPCFLSFD